MKIVFLGCGYLGFNLSELLKNEHDVEVWGLKNPYSSLSTMFCEIDVFDIDSLASMDLEDAVIIDTVSLLGNNAKSDNEQEVLDSLCNKYLKLFNYFKQRKIHTYYFISSGGTVYGDSNLPISENHHLHPRTLYAKSKERLEQCIIDSNLNYVILRLSNPYGGFQVTDKKQGVIPVLIEKVVKGEVFELWGNLTTVRDYIYITDLSSAINHLIKRNASKEIVNVGSGLGTSLQQVFDEVEMATKAKINLKHCLSDVPIVESIILDITKLKELTDFDIQVSLQEGIQKEVERIKEELK